VRLHNMSDLPNSANVFRQPEKEKIEKKLVEQNRPLHQSDLLPKIVKNRHIDGIIIEKGLIADIPSGTTNTKAYFAEDESKLYIWNSVNEAWESSTLS